MKKFLTPEEKNYILDRYEYTYLAELGRALNRNPATVLYFLNSNRLKPMKYSKPNQKTVKLKGVRRKVYCTIELWVDGQLLDELKCENNADPEKMMAFLRNKYSHLEQAITFSKRIRSNFPPIESEPMMWVVDREAVNWGNRMAYERLKQAR